MIAAHRSYPSLCIVIVRRAAGSGRSGTNSTLRSPFPSGEPGTATPIASNGGRDDWSIRIDQVEAYEILQYGNYHITWWTNKEAGIARNRQPYRGLNTPAPTKEERLVCHLFKKEAKKE